MMITGTTLLKYRQKYDTKTYFKKRFTKVLIPAIAWMLIMFVWHVFVQKDFDVSSLSIRDIVNIFTTNQENSVYYYLFVILGVYLTIPLFAPLAENKNKKLLWYGVIAFFVFNALLPNLCSLIGIYYNGDFSLHIGGYMVYVFLGYLLSSTEIPKKWRILIYAAGVFAIAWRFFTTLNMSIAADSLVTTSWGYWQFHTIILTAAIYLFFKNLPLDKLSDRAKRILIKLASCSFGVYLSHILIMHYENRFFYNVFGLQSDSWICRYIYPLLTYALCVGLVLLLKKIPYVRKIVP